MFVIHEYGAVKNGRVIWHARKLDTFAIEAIERNGRHTWQVKNDAGHVVRASVADYDTARDSLSAAYDAVCGDTFPVK